MGCFSGSTRRVVVHPRPTQSLLQRSWILFLPGDSYKTRPLFLIAHAQGLEISDLMVRATLINASAQSFTGVFSDVAQTLLMTTSPSSAAPLSGSIQETTRRLVARPTSIQIVQATMGVLLAVVIAVYL